MNPKYWQDRLNTDSILVKAINGLRAITTASYSEQNVQNGLQYFFRRAYPKVDPILSGTSRDILFRTGSKKVLFKSRIVSFIGEEFRIEVFENPTAADDGTPISVGNYNRVNPVSSTVSVFDSPTLSDDGTAFSGDPEYYFGSSATGQRVGDSIPEGRERVLPENTDYLIRITNTGTGSSRFQYFGDWYEGDPAMPNEDLT